jgi:hypothetical protein
MEAMKNGAFMEGEFLNSNNIILFEKRNGINVLTLFADEKLSFPLKLFIFLIEFPQEQLRSRTFCGT